MTQSNIHATIIELTCRRLKCAAMIQSLKAHLKLPVNDSKREKNIIHRLLKQSSNNIDIKTIWSFLFKISKSVRTKNHTFVEPNVDLLSTLRCEIDNIDDELIAVFLKLKTYHYDSNILLNGIIDRHVDYRFRLTDECVKLLQELFERLSNKETIFNHDK